MTLTEVWEALWARRAYAQLVITEYAGREPEHEFVVGASFAGAPFVIEVRAQPYALSRAVIAGDRIRIYGRPRARYGGWRYAERCVMQGAAPVALTCNIPPRTPRSGVPSQP